MNRALALSLLCLSLAISSCTVSKRISYLDMPDEAGPAETPVDAAYYEAKYGKCDGVWLLRETAIEHTGAKESADLAFGGSWKFVSVVHLKRIVFNPDVAYLTSVRIPIKPDRMYMKVTTPDGVVRQYGLDDLHEEGEGYGKYYTFVYPNIVKGTVIEEGWERVYTVAGYVPLEHDIPLQFAIPCEKVKMVYAYPEWWQIAVKRTGPIRTTPYSMAPDPDYKAHKMIMSYEATDVPAIEPEPFAPYFKEVADYLQWQVEDLKMGHADYERASSWTELAKEFSDYALKKSGKGKDEVAAMADEIVKNCTTDREKVEAITAWVSENIEMDYTDFDGNYSKVLANKKGTVFEITGLTQALLDHAGIRSWYILVHSSEEGYFDEFFVSHDQLAVPAVRAFVDDRDYVLFPYMERLPIDHIPQWFEGQRALMLQDEEATLWTLPAGNLADNLKGEEYDITIDPLGALHVTEKLTARGSHAYELREEIRLLKESEMEEYLRDLMAYTDGSVNLDSFKVLNLEDYRDPLEIMLYCTVDNLVTLASDEVIFHTAGLLSPISHFEYNETIEDRVNPVKVSYDASYQKKITIHYPADWRPETVLDNKDLENALGKITGVYAVEPGVMTITQEAALKRGLWPKKEITTLLELVGKNSILEVPTIVFVVEEPAGM